MTNHRSAFPDPGESPESYVRLVLARMEVGYREMALRAIADWSLTEIVSSELFRPMAGLQRPSWGHWNGMVEALRAARKKAFASASDDTRARLASARELASVLAFFDGKSDKAIVERVRPLAGLVHVKLAGSPRTGQLLSLAIALRNRIAHDSPTDPAWWREAAAALRPLAELWETPGFLPERPAELPAPWFVTIDGTVYTFQGLTPAMSALHVSPEGRSREDAEAGAAIVAILARLLGRSAGQEKDFRALLSKVAPEEFRGVLLGDFLVGAPVGSGGFATVHRGRQLSTGRPVAIKIPHAGLGPEARQRFHLEAEVLSRFNHPNIVSIVGFGEDTWSAPRDISLDELEWYQELRRGPAIRQYLAMEWLDGETLDHHAGPTGKPIELRRAVDWFAQVAGAMEIVHAAGFIHRDLKPSNLFLTSDGFVKILDFGIARVRDELQSASLTADGEAPGSLAYMAPEQLRAATADAEVGPRADVYALCASFYEIFTRTYLFEHTTTTYDALRARKLEDARPEPARHLVRELPWELETILLVGLEPSPADRYASMRELERDLLHVLADEPIERGRTHWTRRVLLAYRRHRRVFQLSGVIAATVVVSMIVFAVLWRKAERARVAAMRQALVSHARERISRGESEGAVAYALAATSLPGRANDGGELDELVAEVAFAPMARALPSHRSAIVGVHLSPDGQNGTTVSKDGEVRLWDLAAGSLKRRITLDGRGVDAFVASSDGATLYLALDDRAVVRMAPDRGAPRPMASLPSRSKWLSLSSDGRRMVAVGEDGLVRVFDVADPSRTKTYRAREPNERDRHEATTAIFSPVEGELLVGVIDGCVLLLSDDRRPERIGSLGSWSVGSLVRMHTGARFVGMATSLLAWEFGPRGAGADRALRTGPAIDFERSGTVALSRDDRFAVVGLLSGEARLVDLGTGATVSSLGRQGSGAITSVATSDDVSSVLLGGSDGSVRLWHPGHGRSRVLFQSTEGDFNALARLPSGDIVAAGDYGVTVVVDPRTGQVRGQVRADHHSFTLAVAASPDGSRIFTSGTDGIVRAWDGRTFEARPETYQAASAVYALAASPDGRSLAIGDRGGKIAILASQGLERIREVDALSEDVWSLAFSPDGRSLAVGAQGADALLIDVASGGVRRFEATLGLVSEVAFSPDGRSIALGSYTGSVALYDVREARIRWRRDKHTDRVVSLAFAPDGASLASGSRDADIRIWSTAEGRLLGRLTDHGDVVTGLAFLGPSLLASASFDDSVRVSRLDGIGASAERSLAASITNLRVCQGGFRLGPVLPFSESLDADAVASDCAGTAAASTPSSHDGAR